MLENLNSLRDEVVRALDQAPVRRQYSESARQRFLLTAITAARPARARGRRPLWLAAAAALAAAATAFLLWWLQPVSFQIGPATTGRTHEWLTTDVSPVPLRFSEGSSIVLAPQTRARVAAVDRRGSRVELSSGQLDVAIAHRSRARWVFQAGPFEVLVTGTRFGVRWDPDEAVLSVAMTEGSVRLSGRCLRDGPMRLVAGQRAELRCPEHRPIAAPLPTPADTAVVSGPDQGPEVPPAGRPAASEPARAKQPPPANAAQWQRLAAAGRYRAALATLPPRAFSQALGRLPEGELLRLASVARLADDVPRARQAFQALRRRFPGREAAAISAFTLGRIAFEQQRDPRSAARWFDLYLRERPNGPLAADALGRLVEANAVSGDLSAARARAREYLTRHPSGSYAGLARSIIAE